MEKLRISRRGEAKKKPGDFLTEFFTGGEFSTIQALEAMSDKIYYVNPVIKMKDTCVEFHFPYAMPLVFFQ